MSVTKKYRQARSGRRGQIMVILALAAVGLVGIAALGIDVFYIYWNKNRLQSGTDAAALAGATYFSNVTFNGKNALCLYPTDAQNAACTYALNNGVVLSELTGVVANAGAQSITVSASRTVSAMFARVVGIQNFTVSAISVAVLQGISSAVGVAPIGLDSLTPYTYGQSINLRMNSCGAGCWQGLAQQSSSSGSTGAAAFQQNLTQGCSCTVRVGDLLTAEPGVKNGAVTNGISDRVAAGLASDPSGTWSSHTMDDARAVVVPVVNWVSGCNGGRCSSQVPVTGFAEVWISGTTGGSTINAVFIRQVEAGTPDTGGSNMGAVHAQLTQ
ncbi:MAG TPA: Tad domain-containing protein [Candidatus Binataceae bacterium]|jgi:Putative Flp pilus-assembly TadE/G-like|nr:Tad domain-containing protein [Candidatus Binataceae bacterium]